jgi:hypothetical protein
MTVTGACPLTPSLVAVTVAVPGAIPSTIPVPLTETIPAGEALQLTERSAAI